MNSFFRIVFFVGIINILFIGLPSCGDDDDAGEITTGPAAVIAGNFTGRLIMNNEITEDVSLKVVAVYPLKIRLEFRGNNLPSFQEARLLVTEDNNNTIVNSESMNNGVTINYNIGEKELVYKFFNSKKELVYTFTGYK